MSSDSEMAIFEVSSAESVFRGAAEAPKEARARAAGEENDTGRVALHEQLTRWCLVDGRVLGGGDDDVGDDYFPGNGARKVLDGYELVNPKRKVMM